MSKKGLFIVFDGPDGVGHTTQVEKVSKLLINAGYNTIITHEPDEDNEYGKAARFYSSSTAPKIDPKEHQLYFINNRALHVIKIIQWVRAGLIVLCDRYTYSTIAYGSVDGASWDELLAFNAHFPIPDMTIFFEAPVTVAMDRLENREGKKERFENSEFQTKVKENYKRLKDLCPEVRTVNADLKPEAVTEQILWYLKSIIPELTLDIIDK